MERSLNAPNRYALIIDAETIAEALKRTAQWDLPGRVCRPLDHRAGKCANVELARYDAEVDKAPLTDEELDMINAMTFPECMEPSVDMDFKSDEAADEDDV